MLVEALRLIVTIAAVVGANRLTAGLTLPSMSAQSSAVIVTVLGAAVGYLAGGVIARGVDRALRGAEERAARHHASEILAATLGLLVGGVGSALLSWPLAAFVRPKVVAYPAAAVVSLVLLTFSLRLAVRKRGEIFGVLGVAPSGDGTPGGCLLDSSAAIDGRVLALYKAGLLPQPLCVPAFVIWEMQGIADSEDPQRRRRGRRGLDVLASLREAGATVRVLEEDPAGTTDPDAKLVVLARRRGMPIVTTDTNLARVAELQGVGVLNLHALADLLRPPVLPGERLRVRVIREGKEPGQGVAYLDDGTMVVVERAAHLLGEELSVEVTSVMQTQGGRMLFAKPEGERGELREAR
jgi:uncharacterized protein YacL